MSSRRDRWLNGLLDAFNLGADLAFYAGMTVAGSLVAYGTWRMLRAAALWLFN